uniref:Uncharacterized protein n=1 Tax=Bos indicus x Bos taurus TaxID=30522 RepID=A0A4W2I7U1_BOBOX
MDERTKHRHAQTHPEVLGIHVIHMQLVTVQLTQLSEGTFEVVQILNSFSEGGQHLLAMGLDLGVSHYGRGRGQVAKAVKESLGPGVDDQDLASSLFHIDFAPQASDNPPLSPTLFSTHSPFSPSVLPLSSSTIVSIPPILLLPE